FGAAVAARAGVLHEAVERVVLVAPPVHHLPIDFGALATSGTSVFVVAGAEDALAPADDVEGAAAGLRVHRVPGASHEFGRGLSQLGQYISSVFEQDDARWI